LRKKEAREQRFEFEGIDLERWERIKARAETFLGIKFPGFMGQTGGELNISWRYVPVAKTLFFRVISRPKWLGAHYPGEILLSLVFGFVKDGKREESF
jgi:hypothetical protein